MLGEKILCLIEIHFSHRSGLKVGCVVAQRISFSSVFYFENWLSVLSRHLPVEILIDDATVSLWCLLADSKTLDGKVITVSTQFCDLLLRCGY